MLHINLYFSHWVFFEFMKISIFLFLSAQIVIGFSHSYNDRSGLLSRMQKLYMDNNDENSLLRELHEWLFTHIQKDMCAKKELPWSLTLSVV